MLRLPLKGCNDPDAYIEIAMRGTPDNGVAADRGKWPSVSAVDMGSFMIEKLKLTEELEREGRLTKLSKQELTDEEARLMERI